jgi:hypothetical protein
LKQVASLLSKWNQFSKAALPVSLARHTARRAARRRLLGLAQARRRLLRLRCTSGCLGTSRGSSRGSSRRSSSTTPPRAGSSSTTPPRAGSSSTTSPPPRVRVPRHVARLVMQLVAPLIVDYSASRWLVVDYFASAARPGASARRATRHAARRPARRRLLRLAQAHRRLLRLRRASGASARCAARYAARRAARRRLLRLAQARRRLLRLRRASGCLGTPRSSSCGSSRRSSSTTPPCTGSSSTTSHPPRIRVPWHIARLVMRHVALLVVDYSALRRLVVDYSASRRLVVDNSTSRRLVVDYFTSAMRPGASARHATRHAACRVAGPRQLRLAQARRQLLHLRCSSGCLGMSRGSSCGTSRRSS